MSFPNIFYGDGTDQSTALESAINASINDLTLWIQGNVKITRTLNIAPATTGADKYNLTVCNLGSGQITGDGIAVGSEGRSLLSFSNTTPWGAVVFDSIAFEGVTSETVNGYVAVLLPNGQADSFHLLNCDRHNCGVIIAVQKSPSDCSPIPGFSGKVIGGRLTSDDTGLTGTAIIMRNGEYPDDPDTVPPEPRRLLVVNDGTVAERDFGLWVSGQTIDISGPDSDNFDLFNIGGLSTFVHVTDNKGRNRNPGCAMQIDTHPGGDGMEISGNQLLNIQLVIKDTLGSYTDRGLSQPTVDRHRHVHDNILLFTDDYAGEFAILVPATLTNIHDNFIHAPRSDLMTSFTAIVWGETDAAYQTYGTYHVDGSGHTVYGVPVQLVFYDNIHDNIISLPIQDPTTGSGTVTPLLKTDKRTLSRCHDNIFLGGTTSGIPNHTTDGELSKPGSWTNNLWVGTDNWPDADFAVVGVATQFTGNQFLTFAGANDARVTKGVNPVLNPGTWNPFVVDTGTVGTDVEVSGGRDYVVALTGSGDVSKINSGTPGRKITFLWASGTPSLKSTGLTTPANRIRTNAAASRIYLDSDRQTVTLTCQNDLSWLADSFSPTYLGSYAVASLPAAVAGNTAYASNGRMYNGAGVLEPAGSGTGGLVTYNGSAWKVTGTNQTVLA